MPSQRLRLLHFVVQPVLVWDDGDTLTAGPSIQPQQVSDLAAYAALVPDEIAKIEASQPAT